jgi:hypothetical protein
MDASISTHRLNRHARRVWFIGVAVPQIVSASHCYLIFSPVPGRARTGGRTALRLSIVSVDRIACCTSDNAMETGPSVGEGNLSNHTAMTTRSTLKNSRDNPFDFSVHQRFGLGFNTYIKIKAQVLQGTRAFTSSSRAESGGGFRSRIPQRLRSSHCFSTMWPIWKRRGLLPKGK